MTGRPGCGLPVLTLLWKVEKRNGRGSEGREVMSQKVVTRVESRPRAAGVKMDREKVLERFQQRNQ